MKISIVLHYWIGLVGMHLLLTRGFGLRFLPGVVFLASVFTLSGAVALHLSYGHANFLAALYLPLLMYFFLVAIQTGAIKHAVMGGATLALMVFNGGLHIVPMTAALVGVAAVVSSISRRDWHPLAIASLIGIFGGLFAAPKLVPMLWFVRSPQFMDARFVAHPDLMTLEMLVRSLIDPFQNRGLKFAGQTYAWIEYGNYVGFPFALAAAVCVIWIIADRRLANRWLGLSLAVTTLVLLAVSAGEFASWAPASLVEHIPFFSSFRVPSRYTIVTVLCAVMTVAWMVHVLDLERYVPKVRVALVILCLLGVADLVMRNSFLLGGSLAYQPVEGKLQWLAGSTTLVTDAATDGFQPDSPMFRSLMKGQAIYRCYDVMQLARKADTSHPLIWASGDATILTTRFSPNRVQFGVVGGRERSRVRLNQNFAIGWRSDAGEVEPDPETGQPSVVLSPGQTGTFAFVFLPPGLILGCVLAILGIAAAGYGWRRSIRSRL